MFSWYKYLIVSLVFWSGNLFLIAPFPDLCLLVPFDSFFNVLLEHNSVEIPLGEERGIWIARRLFPTVFLC